MKFHLPNVLSFYTAKSELDIPDESEPDEPVITEPEKPQETPETGSEEIVELRRENFILKDKLERIRKILEEQEGD